MKQVVAFMFIAKSTLDWQNSLMYKLRIDQEINKNDIGMQ